MEILRSKLKIIIIMLLLTVGLVLSVYLVSVQQILKSRASSEIDAALNVTDEAGNELRYVGGGVYNTNSLKVKVGIKDLESLK